MVYKVTDPLKPYLRGRPIDLWEVGKIAAGSRWRDELERALATARVAILLVSADFLASDAIAEQQLPGLLAAEEGKRLTILPLVVGSCAYSDTALEKFEPLNSPQRPLDDLSRPEQNRELVRVAKTIDDSLRK